ncbi:hypothetical protein, partial [Mesorhizobium sp. GbtcB19]|uniref:hypothetical protein n=1 Tax=Mesorhizobium sp. GbtcB19 TaxID=2824764 RepID=UPI001C2F1B61
MVEDIFDRGIAEKGAVTNINVPSLKAGGPKGVAVTRPAEHGTRSTFRLDKVHASGWRVGVALGES